MYNQYELAARMRTCWAGQRICFFDSTDSTNLRAKQEAENGGAHGTLIAADAQTAGRGRRGRDWDSPAGANVYFTLLLRPDIPSDKAPMLTLVMAHAVAGGILETLRGMGASRQSIGVKWPNDIVAGGRKVCGILTEMGMEQKAVQYVVIGVGINVHRRDFKGELADRAASLEAVCGCKINRSELVANIMRAFEADYEVFCDRGNLSGLQESYNALLVNRGREVRVLDPKGEYSGTARGISSTGELLVELPDGAMREIYAGEVSVRGVYGYI